MLPLRRLSAVVALGALVAAADAQQAGRVDLELVLAVDISRSMDYEEHELQRNGYVEAFRHKDVIEALLSGPNGRIAVTYMEWGAGAYQTIPWTIIDSKEASNRFADQLAEAPLDSERRTSISTALMKAEQLITGNDIQAARRVIDVSGDGANNVGLPVEQARDSVIKAGIIINGLPILLNKPRQGFDVDHLDRYYRHCVIGGPGAFIAPVFNLNQLSATIRKKLVMEIAGLDIEPDEAPIQYADAEIPAHAGEPRLQRVQLKLPTEKSDCLAGEKARARREGGGFEYFDR